MDLAELKFVVNTEDLVSAAKKIADLGTEVSKLNKPMQNLTKESAKTNKELSKAEEAAAKAALAQAKLEQAQAKSAQAAAKSSSVLERQNLILEYMAQGNSKGQASILATAKAAGALDDEMLALNKTLVTQRTLIGGDPFDKSIGLMQKLQNEYKTTTEVTNLFNKNLGLTQKQMTDLAREKERLIALYGVEGKSLDGLSAEYDQLIQKSAMINKANDDRTNSMKVQIKAQNDTAKANEYMAQELERVNRLTESSGNLTSATNNKIIKFEQALKLSGQTAAQQVVALEKYKTSLMSIQKAGGDRQVDYLSRALGPQITDIFVGLYSGQSPMTVLVQQGGQLRDQFALAGVEGSKMGEMLVKAAGSMLTSIKDVGMAVGQVFVTAIVGAGKSVTNFAMHITGANVLLDVFRAKIIATAGGDSLALKAFDLLGKGIVAFAGIITFTAIAALVAFGVAMSDVIKEENALNRALNLTGAAMGVSLDAAYSAARGMEELGVSTGTALEVLTEMAKAGGMSASSLETVATTAKALKTAFDIPIADTVKQFKELQEKPTESLIKLAKQLGTIPVEILKQVDAYEKAGDSIKAAELATKTYADAGKDAADRTVQNFGTITRLGISLGKIWNSTWESIMGIGRIDTNDEKITNLSKRLVTLLAAQDPRQIANRKPMVDATIAEIQAIALQIAKEKELAEQRAKSSTEATKFEKDRKDKSEKTTKATKELTDLEKERIEFLKVMSDLEDRASGFTKNYSDQLNILNIGLTEGWLTQDQFNIKLQELNKIQPGVIKAHKDRADALAKMTESQKKADDALFDSLDIQHQLNMQILEQTDLLALEGSLIGATDAQRKKALGTKRLDLQLEKEIIAIKNSPISATEQEAQIARARQRRLDAEKNLNTEIANDFSAEMQKQYDIISNGLSDAVMTGLFEGGKAGRKALRDLIVAELKKPIRLVIDAVVNATLGSFIQSLVGGAGGSAASSFAGSATGSAATGGISNMAIGGATLGAQAGAFGQGVASGFSFGAPVSSMGTATSASFNAGATYGAPVAGVLAGVYGGRAVSGGYSAMGGASGNSAVNVGTAIGLAIAGPLGAALGGLAGGAFNRTFGRKLTDVGIRGTLGGETGFEGERYTFEKGGTFRKDKTRTSLLEEADRSAIASDFRLIKGSVMELAESAGFGSDAIKDFTAKFQINLKGLSPEDAVKKYEEEFAKIEESMAKAVIGTSGYRRENETSVQTLTRISTFMGGVNAAFGKLGFSLYDLNLESVDAAQSFVDLFGGIEGFNKAMGFFYDNFFSDTEKMENLTTDLTTAFGELGLELPNTREAFRALVTAAKEAGDDQQVKNLLDLQYAFAELVPVTEEVVDTIDILTETMKGLLKERADLEIELLRVQGRTEEANAALRRIATEGFTDAEIAAYDFNESLRLQIQGYKDAKAAAEDFLKSIPKATDDSYAALERAVNAEKAAIDSSIQNKQNDIDSLKQRQSAISGSFQSLNSIFELISKNVKELYAEVDSTSRISTSSARAFIRETIATGSLPDSEKLSDAIGTVRSTLDKTYFKTKLDSDRERLLFANELSGLQNLSSNQITNEQKIINNLERQIVESENQISVLNKQKENLDEILIDARTQIDVLRDIDNSVISVKTAIGNLSTAIATESVSKSAGQARTSIGKSKFTQDEILGAARDIQSNSSTQDQADYNIGVAAIAAGVSSLELANALGITQEYVLQRARELGIPAFAAGGSYSGGLALVGEQGPELINFNQGGQVYNAGQTGGIFSNSEKTAELLVQLNNNIVALRSDVKVDSTTNSKILRLLERVSPDGNTLSVTTATA